jgi:hypothetical protein
VPQLIAAPSIWEPLQLEEPIGLPSAVPGLSEGLGGMAGLGDACGGLTVGGLAAGEGGFGPVGAGLATLSLSSERWLSDLWQMAALVCRPSWPGYGGECRAGLPVHCFSSLTYASLA